VNEDVYRKWRIAALWTTAILGLIGVVRLAAGDVSEALWTFGFLGAILLFRFVGTRKSSFKQREILSSRQKVYLVMVLVVGLVGALVAGIWMAASR
jgi:hypothetical protein